MPRRSATTATASTPTSSSAQAKGKLPVNLEAPVLRSSAWTSAAHLGSLFTPSTAELETLDSASTLSSTTSSSSFELDPSAEPAPSASPVVTAGPRREAAYDFHTTPIPQGALVLLGSAGKIPSPAVIAPNDMALNRRNSPAAGARTASASSNSGGGGSSAGGRQTKVWAGPKGKMPFLQRWKIWYGGVSVIEMLETWETVLYHSIILVALFAVFCALAYLPAHVSTMIKRAQWYISGVDASA